MTELELLELRLRTILPPTYRDRYNDVQPVSMGSAGLCFAEDGRVAWDRMWGSFCDLAMAGGPPHKGTLLLPGTAAEMAAQPYAYGQAVAEICRGIALVTGLPVEASPDAGWVRVTCTSHAMAQWLLRAVTMENVSARCCEGRTLDLPAGPGFRLEKEIKNVITAIAKTCHYWVDHLPAAQQREIASLFEVLERERPLVVSGEWVGRDCESVSAAIWMMRALVVSQVLARREGTVLFVPTGEVVAEVVERVYGLWKQR